MGMGELVPVWATALPLGATPICPPTQPPFGRPPTQGPASSDKQSQGKTLLPPEKDQGVYDMIAGLPSLCIQGLVSRWNPGGLGIQSQVLESWAVCPEPPHREQGEGGE